ncbi:MAG: hypothetical protein Tsb0013_22020 [Phycisphaerales bacterium]
MSTTTDTRWQQTIDLIHETCTSGTLPTRDGGTWDIYPAGIDLHAALALHEHAHEAGAVRTLETGLGMGISALALGAAAMRNDEQAASHTAVDPSAHWCGYAGLDLVTRSHVAPHFRHISESSLTALPRLLLAGETFDFVFIDGAHHFDAALTDLIYAMMMLPPDGLCAVDDAHLPPVRLALDYVMTNLSVETVPAKHDALVILRRPTAFPPKREWDHFVPFTHEPRIA